MYSLLIHFFQALGLFASIDPYMQILFTFSYTLLFMSASKGCLEDIWVRSPCALLAKAR